MRDKKSISNLDNGLSKQNRLEDQEMKGILGGREKLSSLRRVFILFKGIIPQ